MQDPGVCALKYYPFYEPICQDGQVAAVHCKAKKY